DLGCGSGPWIAGLVSGSVESGGLFAGLLSSNDAALKTGILVCVIFPVLFLAGLIIFRHNRRAVPSGSSPGLL
ncbi:MAG: hypothetical protein FWF22_01355, partial [Treponema sp.]|nr:hypothetical protein [Treponema sp.]